MPALLPLGDARTRKATGGLIGTAAHRGPLCLIGPAAVMKRGYISRPLIINAAAEIVKEASILAGAEPKRTRKRERAKTRSPADFRRKTGNQEMETHGVLVECPSGALRVIALSRFRVLLSSPH